MLIVYKICFHYFLLSLIILPSIEPFFPIIIFKMNADPLELVGFDPVTFINNAFPDEESLQNLDTFTEGMSSQIAVLEEEISRTVQTQSLQGQQASKDIAEAQSYIEDLFSKMGDIKSKASNSEKMVQEICADIKKLDIAKTHLQTSITSLKRLQMLITAVGQLEVLAKDYQYREAANLLDAGMSESKSTGIFT